MSEQVQEPDVDLNIIYREILQLKNDIKTLNDRMVTQFALLQNPLEKIKDITEEIRDTVQDESQEQAPEQEGAATTSDPYGFGAFDGTTDTPRPRDKGKKKEEPTPRTGLGMAASSTGRLGEVGEPQTIFGPPKRTIPPIASTASTPTRNRSPTREQARGRSQTRQPSPAQGRRKRKVKLDPPSKLKSIIPKDVKKWILDATVWAQYYADEFENEQEVILHLFTLLDGELADWASPFMAKLLARPLTAPIRTLETFYRTLVEAYGDPDAERAAARKITELSQTGTTVEYTTKFHTLAAELSWNDSALMGQYHRGLHWKVREVLSQKDTQPTTLQQLITVAQRIDAVRRENEESRPKKEKTKEKGKTTQVSGSATKEKVADKENFVDREERDRRRKEGLCIKCGESGHSIKECPNGWRKSKLKKEEKKEIKKENTKVAQDKPEEVEVEAESGKE